MERSDREAEVGKLRQRDNRLDLLPTCRATFAVVVVTAVVVGAASVIVVVLVGFWVSF